MNLQNDPVIKNKEFNKILTTAMKDCLIYLINTGEEFSITVEKINVEFNPEIPGSFMAKFGPVVTFNISNYSLETFTIHADNYISFEAGFGDENPIGSTLSINISNIYSIVYKGIPLLVNLSAGLFSGHNEPSVESLKDDIDIEGINKSASNFLSNPENAKFFKK